MRHRSSQGVQYQGLRQQLRTKAQTTLYFAKLSNSRKWRYTCAQCMQNRPVHHIIATPFALRPTQQPLLSLPSRRSLLKKKEKTRESWQAARNSSERRRFCTFISCQAYILGQSVSILSHRHIAAITWHFCSNMPQHASQTRITEITTKQKSNTGKTGVDR